MTLRLTATRPLALLLAMLACSLPAAAAQQCSFGIDAALEITPDRIVIDDDALGQVVMNAGGALEVDGRDLTLDADQQDAVDAYAAQLREVVPAVIEVALEGMEVGVTAVTEVFAALVGGEAPAAIDEALAELRADVDARLGRREDVWYVNRNGIANLEETMDSMEPLIENAVTRSLGAMFMALGQAMSSGDGDLSTRMDAFAARMEGLEGDIEARVEQRAEVLEARASSLCAELHALEAREAAMKSRVEALAELQVLTRT